MTVIRSSKTMKNFEPKLSDLIHLTPHASTVKISWQIDTWFNRYGENTVTVWKLNAPILYYLWPSFDMLRVLGWHGMVYTTFQIHDKTSRPNTKLQTQNLLLAAKAHRSCTMHLHLHDSTKHWSSVLAKWFGAYPNIHKNLLHGQKCKKSWFLIKIWCLSKAQHPLQTLRNKPLRLLY